MEEQCQCCKTNKAEQEHTCPYKTEINDDYDSTCNCCNKCEHECYMDI